MPEAAEVELVRRGLSEVLSNGSIKRIDLIDPKFQKLEVARLSFPEKVIAVKRHGKLIGIELSDWTFALHLRLAGRIVVGPDDSSRAIFHFKNSQSQGMISFSDPRKFATLKMIRPDEFGSDLGVDLLSGNIDTWRPPLKSTRAVKAVMLDQTEIAGIGNYLIDEALWKLKINPSEQFKNLKDADAKNIAYAARKVAQGALNAGGVSIRDYVDLSGKEGSFQLQLNAYGRSGRPCRRCGRDLEKTTVAGRGTTFCSFCQS